MSGLHLYNRWKSSAEDNLSALIQHLGDTETSGYFLATGEVKDVKGLLKTLSEATDPFRSDLKARFSFEGKKLFDVSYIEEKNEVFLLAQLLSELNIILEGESLYDQERLAGVNLSAATTELLASHPAQSPTS